MTAKNQVLSALTVALFFVSCKKDLIAPEPVEAIRSEAIASDATANDVPETARPSHKPIYTNVNGNVAGYLETLPARYKLTTKRYPMILFIHGIGELGTGLTRMNCCGLPMRINKGLFPPEFNVNGVRHSFIVISPQFKRRPSAADMQSVINYAVNKYRIDPTRIYIAGLSMGGGSTWDYSAVYGQNVAAAVPVCGGTRPTTALAGKIASKNLPVWTISSIADRAVPIQWAKDWISWIDRANPAVAALTKLTILTAEDHNKTWDRAFNPAVRWDGKNVYEWMLQFRRTGGSVTTPVPTPTPAPKPTPAPTANKKPIAYAGADKTLPLSWITSRYSPTIDANRSKDPDGWISRFSWAKISGPAASLQVVNAGKSKLTGLTAGTYVFRVTVTDNKGATATDDVKIVITRN